MTFVQGKVETLLGLEGSGLPLSDRKTMDVIVSERMGYTLFFKTLLPSVVAACNTVMMPLHPGPCS